MRVDVHQHLWSRPLLERLAERRELPRIDDLDGATVLRSPGECPYPVALASEDPAARARLIRADGLDLALVSLSSPIGIEGLAREQAGPLIEAYLQGVEDLPREFGAWGPIALDRPIATDVDAALERRCVGISLSAGALAERAGLSELGPVLARAAARRVPVFVHPGPGRRHTTQAEAPAGEPAWWRPLTDYVWQMQAAWLTFCALGRAEHPELVVVFAMLAGGAPLLSERLATRAGPPVDLRDPRTFYDTSGYGPAAVDMMARRVGVSRLLYGSDRPVVEPTPTGRERELQENAAGLIAASARR